jgi:hypothetical protein
MAGEPPDPLKGFSVDFTVLSNGDNLYCSNEIEVSWMKPEEDSAELRLICKSATTHAEHRATPQALGAGQGQGTHRFTLLHTPTPEQNDVTVRTEIWKGDMFGSGNDRIAITVECPPDPEPEIGKPLDHLQPLVITLDSDKEPVQLVRKKAKYLTGRFNRAFGNQVIVALQKNLGLGKEATHYVAPARMYPFWNPKYWSVWLPYQLWSSATVPLVIRLFLTRSSDGRKATVGFKTKVT